MTTLNLSHVRENFPVFASTKHPRTIYLDNAGGSQILGRVVDRIRDYLVETNVQHGASYAASQRAVERVQLARHQLATMVHAYHDEEVIVGGSTTGLMFLLVQAIRPSIKAGDEIIVTNTDHEANIGAWTRLAEAGAVVKVWEVNRESLQLDIASLERLLSPRTKWVAVTHASNVLGTVNSVAEIAKRVHSVGGRLCVDGVAYAPHRLVDVRASAADIYVFSLYKVFGPHSALMWGHRDFLRELPSLNHYFIGREVVPYKLQPGNLNYELTYGAGGIPDYLAEVGKGLAIEAMSEREYMQVAFDEFAAHEDALANRLLDYLGSKRSVRIIGLPRVTHGDRVPTVSFVVEGMHSSRIPAHLDQFDIGVRYGDFYARRLIEALGLEDRGGVVRVSFAHYNTNAEVDTLLARLEEVLPD